jgi:hypothetical protein
MRKLQQTSALPEEPTVTLMVARWQQEISPPKSNNLVLASSKTSSLLARLSSNSFSDRKTFKEICDLALIIL